jgi:hypothetical protein
VSTRDLDDGLAAMNDLRIAGWSGILFSVLSVIVIR